MQNMITDTKTQKQISIKNISEFSWWKHYRLVYLTLVL